jgi:DNA adenine methylase
MLNDILEIFRNSGKKTIVDVFGGSGKVLLNAEAKVKIYNDLNADVVDFFEEVRKNKESVLEKLNYPLNSRELFTRYKEITDDKTENVFRYFYRNMLSFNGDGKSYSYSSRRNKSATITHMKEAIDTCYNDIKSWTIERLDFRDLIRRYDSEGTFFYLDPPYHNIKGLYEYELTDQDYIEMKALLDEIKGKYLLNINEDDFISNVFGNPQIRKEYTNFGVNGRVSGKTKRIELFYYNFTKVS